MPHLDVMLLGRFEVRLDGKHVEAFGYDKVRALLAYLATESDRSHRRETIAGLLWADYPEHRARQNLSQALLTLRKAIKDNGADPPFLHITRYALQINRDCDHTVDVTSFLSYLKGCDQHSPFDSVMCERCLNRLTQATALYRGDFLATFSLPDSPDFEEWALLERERLRRKALLALDQVAKCHLRRGEHSLALECAQRHILLDPWQEGAHRLAMQALALMGQRRAAIQQYERCLSALDTDLGVSPEPATLELYEQIRAGALPPSQTHRDATTVEPGAHVDAPSPATTQLSAAEERGPPHNLPAPLTPFIGRSTELKSLCEYFRNPHCRMLCLVGPGGSGKTRLAIEAARHCLPEYRDGIYLVSLTALQSRDALAPTIAETIGLHLHAGDFPETRLADYLRNKYLLLILDSFEQAISGLDIIIDLLNAVPALRIVLTSRIRTNAQGETVFLVNGMAVPETARDLNGGNGYGAMALYVAGAQRNYPSFRLTEGNVADVRRICALVHGLPLAVLLAASWVPLLSPAEIAERLSDQFAPSADFLRADWQDMPARQRSLRTVFDHSWQLLTIREKAIFEALSVFRNGFTRAAAKDVVGATLWELRGLVNKSFVGLQRQGRYEIHELMRQYASGKLDHAPLARHEVYARHGLHYLERMKGWATQLKGAEQHRALNELALEIENARSAWTWLLENHHPADLITALQASCLFYERRARYEEGIAHCRLTAEGSHPTIPAIEANMESESDECAQIALRASAMAWLARFKHLLGQTASAETTIKRAMDIVTSAGSSTPPLTTTHAFILEQMGHIAAVHDRDAALHFYHAALTQYQEAEDTWGTANVTYDLGTIGHQTSQYAQSKRWYEKSLALRETLGDQRGIADALIWMGFTDVRQGNVEEGIRLIQRGSEIRKTVGDREGVALATSKLGQALLWAGEVQRSHTLIKESLDLYSSLGIRYQYTYASVFLGCIQCFAGAYEEARKQLEQGLARTRQYGYRREAAFAQFCLAGVALAQDRLVDGLVLADAAIDTYSELSQLDELSWTQGLRAIILHRMGRSSEAWSALKDSLQASIALNAFGTVLWGLPGVALMISEEGNVTKGLEFYTLAQRYPMVANAKWYNDIVGSSIYAAAAELSCDLVAEAKARGRTCDLQPTVAEAMGIVTAHTA